jgi:hypothetical protein
MLPPRDLAVLLDLREGLLFRGTSSDANLHTWPPQHSALYNT